MSKFKPNMEAVRTLIGPWAQREVSRWDRGEMREKIASQKGCLLSFSVDVGNGAIYRNASFDGGGSQTGVIIGYGVHLNTKCPEILYEVILPLDWLSEPPCKYHLYHATFFPYANSPQHPSLTPLHNGYYGITGRAPIERIKEHYRDAMGGRGHIFHKAWHQVAGNVELGIAARSRAVLFELAGRADTLDTIYEMEERAVATETLCPKGLNAIPGGRAGLREMWRLGLAGKQNLTPDERDAVLVDLEEGRAPVSIHYRRGHIRKLAHRTTWVNPCIVGLTAASRVG